MSGEPTQRSRVIRIGIGVGIATATYGISFGALAVAAGFETWQACVLSLVMFTGGSQFALVSVIATGGLAAGVPAIASAALLGTRNALYGMRMSSILGVHGWRRLAAAWATIDESTAVALAQPSVALGRIGFWATAIAVFVGWNIATLTGALIGDALGDVRRWGLDAVAAAALLGMLWPRLATRQAVAVGIGAAVVALAVTPVLAPGLPVLIAAMVAIVVGAFNWFSKPAGR